MQTEYAQSTRSSRQSLRRFAHQRRFDVALSLLQLSSGQSVLDMGAGDGYFLSRAAEVAPNSPLTAVEPDPGMLERLRDALQSLIQTGRLRVFERGDELEPRQFDRMVCLEVMEHLPRRLQRRELQLLHSVARPGARLVISVPVEIGPVVLVKALIRFLSGEPVESWRHLMLAFLGRPVPRPDTDYILDHGGFRYMDLELAIRESPWAIEQRRFSPWTIGGFLLNSQVFYVLMVRSSDLRRDPSVSIR